jgi:glutamate/tyrosine decarboxylase-like PLP-dependent enzyme
MRYNLWFHVDAAYGGFFMLTEEGQIRLKGIEKSDSVCIDPHKGLFIPNGLGAILSFRTHLKTVKLALKILKEKVKMLPTCMPFSEIP